MEYLEGITLKQYLQTYGPISVEEMQNIFAPILEALDKIHQNGVIHRDISPDNIMCLPEGEMKLMDFRTTASNERIENGIRYIPSGAYGFDGSDTYYLYLPGIPLDSLPEDIRQWVWQSYWIQADNVPNYLICGAENQYPFISNEASFE